MLNRLLKTWALAFAVGPSVLKPFLSVSNNINPFNPALRKDLISNNHFEGPVMPK
jgi:hypothetical protein